MMTKKKQVNDTNEITYYCSLHRTTKYSTLFDKNNKRKKLVYAMEKLFIIKIQINII